MDRQSRLSVYDEYLEKANSNYRAENEVTADLLKQLIFFATVLFAFSAAIVKLSDLATYWKVMIAISWALLTISILSGVFQLVLEKDLLRRAAKKQEAIGEYTLETMKSGEQYIEDEVDFAKTINAKKKDVPRFASEWALWIQIYSLEAGTLALLSAVCAAYL